jgi:hypothetical protein
MITFSFVFSSAEVSPQAARRKLHAKFFIRHLREENFT